LALGLHLNAGKTGAGCFPGVAIRRNDIAGEKTKNQQLPDRRFLGKQRMSHSDRGFGARLKDQTEFSVATGYFNVG
jgi:hypothetical protein